MFSWTFRWIAFLVVIMQTADVIFLQLRNHNWMDCILTYSEQSQCAKSTGKQSRFHHNLNREKEKLNPTTLLFLSSVCKGEKKSDMEGCHLKLRSQAPPTGREGTLVQS